MIAKFSIKDLEKISGIKAHTLRIWEQRYGILKPERTDTNIRWYSNDELKQLLNITLLYNCGYKISKIATLKYADLSVEVNKIIESKAMPSEQIDGLIISMVELDEERFEKIITDNIHAKGFAYTIESVVYPFLHKIGIMWQTGGINPAQEHFISNLIRQKIIVGIDSVKTKPESTKNKFVLFLPENELHELSLLYFNYQLKSLGHTVIYLGQSVPQIDLEKVIEIKNPQYLVSVFTHAMENPLEYIQELSSKYQKVKILVSGMQITQFEGSLPQNVQLFRTPSDLLGLIPV